MIQAPNDELLIRMFRAGMKYQAIADAVGMSYSHVSQRIPRLIESPHEEAPCFRVERDQTLMLRAPHHKVFDIKVGDRVKAFDIAINRVETYQVVKIFKYMFLAVSPKGLRTCFSKIDYSIGVVKKLSPAGDTHEDKTYRNPRHSAANFQRSTLEEHTLAAAVFD